MKRWIISFAVGIAVSGMVAQAHHSIVGVYDTSQQVTIEGTVARFEFVNPHPFLVIDVKDSSGSMQAWRLEMDNLSELTEVGMTSQTLKPGDRVVVAGNPSRTRPQSLYMRRLDRPADGFLYEQVGNSPRIRVPR